MRWRLRFAKRSSTRAGALVLGLAAAAVVAVVGLALDSAVVAWLGLAGAIASAGAVAVELIMSELRGHERLRDEEARLVAEAKEREADRVRLTDQLITAEQEERRRIALFLHDGPVQSMSGIALMLDAVSHAVEGNRVDEARQVLDSALERTRDTIRSLRDLSFALEPVVLRDQGFVPAVRALAEQLGMSQKIQIDLDVEEAEKLAERAQVTLYQIIREALHQAIRRGPPTRISIRIGAADGSGVEAVIADNGAGERRRASFDAIAERARTLNGRLTVESGEDGGTEVRVVLPAYTARR